MEGKAIKADIRVIISQGIVGIILLAYILLFKPTQAFGSGLILGYVVAVAISLVLILIFRLRKKRLFGDLDERDQAIMGKAALLTIFATIMGIAAFVLASYVLPDMRNVSAVNFAACVVGFSASAFFLLYLLLRRLP